MSQKIWEEEWRKHMDEATHLDEDEEYECQFGASKWEFDSDFERSKAIIAVARLAADVRLAEVNSKAWVKQVCGVVKTVLVCGTVAYLGTAGAVLVQRLLGI